jgi:hypothetical protein
MGENPEQPRFVKIGELSQGIATPPTTTTSGIAVEGRPIFLLTGGMGAK